jgi:acyl carrier protein
MKQQDNDSKKKADATVHERLQQILADCLRLDKGQIVPDASLIEDLNADSLDLVDLLMEMEDEFKLSIPSQDMLRLHTVQDIENYLSMRSTI